MYRQLIVKKRLGKLWNWIDDRSGYSDYVLPLLTHIVPRDAHWWSVFGSATLTAFFVQVVTGISLAMSYVAGGDKAYASQYIATAPLGSVVRGMHYYGASAMVTLAAISMSPSLPFTRPINTRAS